MSSSRPVSFGSITSSNISWSSAGCSSATGGAKTASGSSMPSWRRSAAIARNCRPRIVPSCLPIASAASRAERPAKNRREMASRWSSVRVASADLTASISWRMTASSSGPASAPARSTDWSEVGVLVACPDVIDDRVPCQAEQPAPEWDTPRLVARQCLQGLDEDELRQVLRVARVAHAAGDVAIDREVEMVEKLTEGPGVPRTSLIHQPLDGGVVECHNEEPGTALGSPRHMWRTSYLSEGHSDPRC